VKCGFGNPHHTLAIYYEYHTELVIQNKEKLTAQKKLAYAVSISELSTTALG